MDIEYGAVDTTAKNDENDMEAIRLTVPDGRISIELSISESSSSTSLISKSSDVSASASESASASVSASDSVIPTSESTTTKQGDKPNGRKEGDWRRIVQLSKPEWKVMGFATFCLLITQLSGMAIPWFFGQMIDISQDLDKTKEERRTEMTKIIITLACIQSCSSIMLFFRGFIFNASGERVVARLRIRLFKAILSQDIAFFDSKKTGELLSRLSNDTAKLQDAATSSLSIFLRQCVTICISITMLFVTSWQLSCGIIIVIPILVLTATKYGRYVKGIAKVSERSERALMKTSILAMDLAKWLQTATWVITN